MTGPGMTVKSPGMTILVLECYRHNSIVSIAVSPVGSSQALVIRLFHPSQPQIARKKKMT